MLRRLLSASTETVIGIVGLVVEIAKAVLSWLLNRKNSDK
jgi:hypothetical protein